jgi:hypothetical protein
MPHPNTPTKQTPAGSRRGTVRYRAREGAWQVRNFMGGELGFHEGPATLAGALAAVGFCVEGGIDLGTWDAERQSFAWTVTP